MQDIEQEIRAALDAHHGTVDEELGRIELGYNQWVNSYIKNNNTMADDKRADLKTMIKKLQHTYSRIPEGEYKDELGEVLDDLTAFDKPKGWVKGGTVKEKPQNG